MTTYFDPKKPLDGLSLRDWQVDAFSSWAAKGCKGVVEAVTGAGKTRLAIACARACLGQGGQVLVLIPTLELQRQWVREARKLIPGINVGRLGGGEAQDFSEVDILIATPHSAADLPLEPHSLGLLIADEAHRYGAPTWAKALHERFDMRLALTATYERNDEGIEDILAPYFGPIIYSYSFKDAAKDKVIAPFSVSLVGVNLTPEEKKNYDQSSKRVSDSRKQMVSLGFSANPKDMIMTASKVISEAEGLSNKRVSHKVVAARGFLTALQKRKAIAARCAGKLDVISAFCDEIDRHNPPKTLIFSDTVEQADDVVSIFLDKGFKAWAIHGGLKEKDRRSRLKAFENNTVPFIVAPRVLDEGIDVPDAYMAIVLSSFRTRRQMIQRLGRVLRLKENNQSAQLIIVGAKDTREDPAMGAQKEFLSEVLEVATHIDSYLLGEKPLLSLT